MTLLSRAERAAHHTIARVGEVGVVTVYFVVSTCLLTYPQVTQLTSAIGAHYDALFSIWRLAWVAHQLPRDPLRLFDSNIFWPEPNTLAYSDALLLQGVLAAPLIWAGASAVTAHNLLILLSFVTAGVAMFLLARSLGSSLAASTLAGSIFAFQPYRFAHYPQLELLWTCWMPLACLYLHRVLSNGRLRDGLLLGVAVSLQIYSCLYYGVFLVLLVGIVAAVLWSVAPDRRASLTAVAAAASIVAMLCAPYARPYLDTRPVVGTRTVEEVRDWSPSPSNYLAVNTDNRIYPWRARRAGHIEGVLFPGAVAVGLAALALLRPSRVVLAYLAAVVIGFDLSLGTNGVLFPLGRALLPPFESLRAPGRAFVIVSTALAVLAGLGASKLARWRGRGGLPVVLALLCLAALESLSVPLTLDHVPPVPRAYAWLAQQPATKIAEWPVPSPTGLGYTRDAEYMFFSTRHWHRLVNGYSGFFPPSYVTFLNVMRRFPDPSSLDYLRQTRVRYVVLHSAPAEERYRELVTRLRRHADVEFVFQDRTTAEEISVFRLRGV